MTRVREELAVTIPSIGDGPARMEGQVHIPTRATAAEAEEGAAEADLAPSTMAVQEGMAATGAKHSVRYRASMASPATAGRRVTRVETEK